MAEVQGACAEGFAGCIFTDEHEHRSNGIWFRAWNIGGANPLRELRCERCGESSLQLDGACRQCGGRLVDAQWFRRTTTDIEALRTDALGLEWCVRVSNESASSQTGLRHGKWLELVFFKTALAEYGRHKQDCTIGGESCSCGLENAKRGLAPGAVVIQVPQRPPQPEKCPICGEVAAPLLVATDGRVLGATHSGGRECRIPTPPSKTSEGA